MRKISGLLAVVFLLAAWGVVSASQKKTVASRQAGEQAILRTSAAWAKAAAAKDVERTLSFWTEDATVYPPGGPAIVGKPAIREYITQGFAMPGFAISWQTGKVEISRSGDLAYAQETNEFRMNDAAGNPVVEKGKGITVWRKQRDGSWKCVIDIWNSIAPAAAPPLR